MTAACSLAQGATPLMMRSGSLTVPGGWVAWSPLVIVRHLLLTATTRSPPTLSGRIVGVKLVSDRYGEPIEPEPDEVFPATVKGWFDYWRSLLGVKPEEPQNER